jgi:predicted nucleotidyltransferase
MRMAVFQEDFRDFLSILSQHGVEFMLIGGYAYNLHVEARVTQDIDVWVRPTRENLERLREALREFISADLNVEELLAMLDTNRLGFGVGLKPNRIEMLLRVNGLEFDPAYARTLEVNVDGLVFRVIHPHDQIRNKRAAGRLKDLADVAMLVKRHGDPDKS